MSSVDIDTTEENYTSNTDQAQDDSDRARSGEPSSTTDSSCHSRCCSESSDADKPFQPSISYAMLSKKQQGKRTRHFKISWYKSYKWLHYCTSQHKVLCFFCRKACKLKLISCNKRRQDAFVSLGFKNWKKYIEKFKEHEKSQMHVESCFKLNALCRPSVATQLSAQILQQQCFHRKMLLKVLSILFYHI